MRCGRDYHGVWGFVPFKVVFPTGEPGIVDYEMGFIGQQPNIGYQLIRYGYETGNKETTQKGLNVIDFWVNNSLTEWGLPKTWYDPYPAGILRPEYMAADDSGRHGGDTGWLQSAKKEGRG